MTEKIASIPTKIDRRMLRYMASLTWNDGLRSEEVSERCARKNWMCGRDEEGCDGLAISREMMRKNHLVELWNWN